VTKRTVSPWTYLQCVVDVLVKTSMEPV
jgi:hypothetical protein